MAIMRSPGPGASGEHDPFAPEVLEDPASAHRTDLCASYAVPLPVLVIARILGVPAADQADFKDWSDQFMAGQNAADPAVQAAARAKIDGYFTDVLARRRKTLTGDGPEKLPDDLLTAPETPRRAAPGPPPRRRPDPSRLVHDVGPR